MGEVEVTPEDTWNKAKKVTAKDTDQGKQYKDVPIRQFLYTPGTATVRKGEFPNGILFLNEKPLPDNNTPIDTTDIHPHFKVVWMAPDQDSVSVEIIEDLGWPNGVIVLPQKVQH